MVFKHASRPDYDWIGLIISRRGCVSRRGPSTHLMESRLRDFALNLPRICGQIYAQTATLVYSED
jgi:hypothetical protein